MLLTTLIGITFVIVSCFASPAINPFRGRIIGGYDANIIDYPYQVSIQIPSFGHFCGGTIYKTNIIVTAAHCVNGMSPSDLTIRAGSSLRTEGGTIVNVKKIIVSKLWNERTVDGDIAILILQKNLPFSDSIKSIELAVSEPKVDEIAHISGWGMVDSENVNEEGDPILPENLQAVEVPIFEWNECNKLLKGKLTKNMFCAGLKTGGKDSCRMDSGGPLVINNKLYGVISWGEKCGNPNSPGVYTNVKNFVDWINQVS